jgi:hypothetical protein
LTAPRFRSTAAVTQLPPSENRETITARQQETHADNKQAFSGTLMYSVR